MKEKERERDSSFYCVFLCKSAFIIIIFYSVHPISLHFICLYHFIFYKNKEGSNVITVVCSVQLKITEWKKL